MKILHILAVILPRPIKIMIYRRTMRAEIEANVKIGMSYIHVKKLVLKEGSVIKNWSVLRNLERLELGKNARIGNRVYATAIPLGSKKHFSHRVDRVPALLMGEGAALTGNHFLDCNDKITIGDFSLFAGRNTFIYTHGIDIMDARQDCAPITIGKHCMIATRSLLLKGAKLPDNSVLGAQSVLTKAYLDTHTLYAGNPAKPVKCLSSDAAFFKRKSWYVE
ncbi:acyltransferase [Celeribacter baekdonensis]|uniref:Acetyltransferase (Isoleucine patch superfamily) n=1 Tax=Celeribacter baekdonensis TaxID=875171 RepID=A0A2R4M8T0_9RHOB|nr:acyltransferase [Celeribacter baekdonensis]AVW93603.1 hypothetical protein DA792_21425 [Celeribacter baekdonensis]